MTTDVSLYDLLGGDRMPLREVTTAFYAKVQADDLISPFFAGVDLDRQAAMLAEFLAMAFGGPHRYSGRDLRTAHALLPGLADPHFDRVALHLAGTLREFGISEDETATVLTVAETVRNDVLNR